MDHPQRPTFCKKDSLMWRLFLAKVLDIVFYMTCCRKKGFPQSILTAATDGVSSCSTIPIAVCPLPPLWPGSQLNAPSNLIPKVWNSEETWSIGTSAKETQSSDWRVVAYKSTTRQKERMFTKSMQDLRMTTNNNNRNPSGVNVTLHKPVGFNRTRNDIEWELKDIAARAGFGKNDYK